jgi:predicted metal-dependent phosphoesterase TrpH
MAKIDHHLHTTRHSPDSIIEPRVLVERAKAAGLDAVVITEHDKQWSPAELLEINAQSDGLLVLSGVEVSAREGHFLVYGLPDLTGVEPGITLGELIQVVQARGAAIVAAHPFRWDQDFAAILADHAEGLDALELVSNNVSRDTRAKTQAMLDQYRLGATGSSDGHDPEAVGCYYTEFPGEIRSMSDFVAAIRSRKGRPRHRAGAWQAAGPVD